MTIPEKETIITELIKKIKNKFSLILIENNFIPYLGYYSEQ